jgi:hypothetical protein
LFLVVIHFCPYFRASSNSARKGISISFMFSVSPFRVYTTPNTSPWKRFRKWRQVSISYFEHVTSLLGFIYGNFENRTVFVARMNVECANTLFIVLPPSLTSTTPKETLSDDVWLFLHCFVSIFSLYSAKARSTAAKLLPHRATYQFRQSHFSRVACGVKGIESHNARNATKSFKSVSLPSFPISNQ